MSSYVVKTHFCSRNRHIEEAKVHPGCRIDCDDDDDDDDDDSDSRHISE